MINLLNEGLARSFGLVGTVSIVDDSPFVYGLAVELSIESHYAFDGMRSAQPLSYLRVARSFLIGFADDLALRADLSDRCKY